MASRAGRPLEGVTSTFQSFLSWINLLKLVSAVSFSDATRFVVSILLIVDQPLEVFFTQAATAFTAEVSILLIVDQPLEVMRKLREVGECASETSFNPSYRGSTS